MSTAGVVLTPARLLALRLRSPEDRPPARGVLPGMYKSRRRGQGQDIADLRTYVQGDDIRHLDPAATARTGELHIRSFHQDQDSALVLIADFRRAMHWGLYRAFRSVALAEALVIAGWQALEHGEKIGLAVITDKTVDGLAPTTRHDTMSRIIGMLCAIHKETIGQSDQSQPISNALTRIACTLPRHARLLIGTGVETRFGNEIPALADRHQVRIMAFGLGLEAGLPRGHYPLAQGGIWNGQAMQTSVAPVPDGVARIILDPAMPPRSIEEAEWPKSQHI